MFIKEIEYSGKTVVAFSAFFSKKTLKSIVWVLIQFQTVFAQVLFSIDMRV